MRHSLGSLNELHLGTVLNTVDPEMRGRIQVRLHATDLDLWASVIVSSAGNGYGISHLPRQNEQVVIAFVSPNIPMVLGAVWSGGDSQPEDAAPVEDRYLMQTPAGTKILLDDQAPSVMISTPAGYHLTINDQGSGTLTLEKGSEKIEMNTSGIHITTSAKVTVNASQIDISAGMVKVDAGLSKFSGVVQCDTLISNTVASLTYTPGAGNIW